MTITFTLIIILVASTIILGLQFFLSTRKTRWLGLILPVICFLLATVITIGIVFSDSIFQGSNSNGSDISAQSSSAINETTDSQPTDEADVVIDPQADTQVDTQTDIQTDAQTDSGSDFTYALLIFCLLNIPTMVLTAIYFSTRQNTQVGTTTRGK